MVKNEKNNLDLYSFKKNYIICLNSLWKSIFSKFNLKKYNDKVPTFFLSFKKFNNKWSLFCEKDFILLGLCHKNYIIDISTNLKNIISKFLEKTKILPIHITLSIFYNNENIVHANSLVIDLENLCFYIFEPKGTINNLLNNLLKDFKTFYLEFWKEMGLKIGLEFKDYILPHCNFQNNDNKLCYIWTSYIETLFILNYNSSIKYMKKYLIEKYKLSNQQYLIDNSLFLLHLKKK